MAERPQRDLSLSYDPAAIGENGTFISMEEVEAKYLEDIELVEPYIHLTPQDLVSAMEKEISLLDLEQDDGSSDFDAGD